MGKFSGFFSVSTGLLIEINVLLIGVCIFFGTSLYQHYVQRKIENLRREIVMEGTSDRMSLMRLMCLIVYLLNAVLGIFLSRSPSLFKFTSYMLIGCISLVLTSAIAGSRYQYYDDYEYFTNMLLLALWRDDRCEQVEKLFDCCGMHGAIDYIVMNETWSQAACCELPNCHGCMKPFYDYLHSIDMEIARDNIVLCVFALIGMIFAVAHHMKYATVNDPYESEESDYENDNKEKLQKRQEYLPKTMSSKLRYADSRSEASFK